MADVDKLKEFAAKLEWEGGWTELASWGEYESGDDKIDALMEKLDCILTDLDSRWSELNSEYDLTSDEEE